MNVNNCIYMIVRQLMVFECIHLIYNYPISYIASLEAYPPRWHDYCCLFWIFRCWE